MSKVITLSEEISQVATISANGDRQIGDQIGNFFFLFKKMLKY